MQADVIAGRHLFARAKSSPAAPPGGHCARNTHIPVAANEAASLSDAKDNRFGRDMRFQCPLPRLNGRRAFKSV